MRRNDLHHSYYYGQPYLGGDKWKEGFLDDVQRTTVQLEAITAKGELPSLPLLKHVETLARLERIYEVETR